MSEDATAEPLTICLVNYDWRDIFRTDKNELREKLERDQLRPDINHFFFFSWAKQTYAAEEGLWQTKHQRTYGLEAMRPVMNIWALFAVPFALRGKGRSIDVWATYDFGMVPALWVCKRIYGGTVVGILNNQPKIYSEVRKFGKVKGMYSWLMERVGARLVDHMFTINLTLKRYLQSIGVPERKITVFAMNTILRDEKDIAAAQRGKVRAQYGIGADKKVIVTVGRLEAEKNWPRSLELFATVPDQYVLFCLGMGSLEEELKHQVADLGIAHRVFFTGFVQRKDIWNYYLDADVFVLLSRAEALGIVFWEAMYVGLPVVGSDVEGIIESVGADGERGRIWNESQGVSGYQERIFFCTQQSPERTAMVARASSYVRERIQNTITINDIPGVKRAK